MPSELFLGVTFACKEAIAAFSIRQPYWRRKGVMVELISVSSA
jgi:hypothetical protein